MTSERLSFDVDSVQKTPAGWRLEGEPGYHPRHWARPGDRFDRLDSARNVQEIALVVVELTDSYAIVTGTGGDQLQPGDTIYGERAVEDGEPFPSGDLAQVLGLSADAVVAMDWAPVERALGTALPGDYKTFVDAHGAGLIDDHLTVCGTADVVEHNAYAHECVRLDFAGPDGYAGDWALGDASHWAADVPDWFEPGDDLISWGHTGNGDFVFWHLTPGTAPDEWPVVFKERGPYWERYATGFADVLTGLLTGRIQSEYLSSWFGGPHSYGR